MNISQDIQPVRPIAPEIQVAVAERVMRGTAEELEAAGADEAHLSVAASLASQASLPDVRQEKVAGVQAALASGTYSVSSQDVAQSLMDHMLGKKD